MAINYVFTSHGRAPEIVSARSFAAMLVSEGIPANLVHSLVEVATRNCRLQATNAVYEGVDARTFRCELIPNHHVEYSPEQITPDLHEQQGLPLAGGVAMTRRMIDRKRAASGERDSDL